MKTQLSKPARDRASYTEEYKREALELWRNSGRSAAKVAVELGIRPPLLYRWAHLPSGAPSNTNSFTTIASPPWPTLALPSSITSKPSTTASGCTPLLLISAQSTLNPN
jgi:hypothetical protein